MYGLKRLLKRPVMLAAAVLAVALGTAPCTARAQNKPSDPTQLFVTEKDSAQLFMEDKDKAATLTVMQFCVDSLGIPSNVRIADSCMPCMPYQTQTTAEGSLSHAVEMWNQLSRAPYNSENHHTNCIRIAFEYATILSGDSYESRFGRALFELAAADPVIRAGALTAMEGLIDTALIHRDSRFAATVYKAMADDISDRSRSMFSRPDRVPPSRIDRDVHELRNALPILHRIPTPPKASRQMGVSEAEWAAKLYQAALDQTDDIAQRAALRRLIVTSFAQVGNWKAVDSVAAAALVAEPGDSVAMIARALAAWQVKRFSLASYPLIEESFMEALRAMPRADSAAYDDFTDVLTPDDDTWRFGFTRNVRQQLDTRAWAVMDPLWLTPVNEVRLARMARKALGDFLFARTSRPGMSGSETDAGTVTMKRGAPDPTWIMVQRAGNAYRGALGWRGMRVVALATDPAFFYSTELRPERLVQERVRCQGATQRILYCARAQAANFNDVLFQSALDTVDVSLARFRSTNDSVDVYLSARIPVRSFRSKDMRGVSNRDSIVYGAMITGTFGEPVFDKRTRRPLPAKNEIAWTDQWTTRTGNGNIMHRVEALDPGNARGARGASFLASNDAALFNLTDFGLSDILVAGKLTPTTDDVTTWRDYEIQPNGGVVMPKHPVSLLWEVYDLKRDADGFNRWQVSIQFGSGEVHRSFNGKLMMSGAPDRTRQVTVTDDTSGTSYTRTAPASNRVVERMQLSVTDAAPGRHVLIITVEDLVAKKTVQREVAIRVMAPFEQARSEKGFPTGDVTGYTLMATETGIAFRQLVAPGR